MQDNTFGCLFILAFIGALAIVGYLTIRGTNRSRAELFSRLARRWSGRVIPGRFLSKPRLLLRVDGIPGEVIFRTSGEERQAWTMVRFNWRAPRRLRVAPETFMSSLRRMLGTNDVQVGEAGFDAAFWIEASDTPWAREALSGRVRQGLLELQRQSGWLAPRTATLDIGPAGMTLKFTRLLVDDSRALESFIALAVLILQQARGPIPVAGVVLAAVEVRGGSPCPVCGHSVESGTRCPSCRMPHHDDCWKYSGGCAIFACGGRARKVA